jgi:biphenyl 2,3-dioxygenase alpha subunit
VARAVGQRRTQDHFPTCSFLPGINTLRVWHPCRPNAIEVWTLAIVDADAAQAVKDEWDAEFTRSFSPAGLFEQDDGENWIEVQRMLRRGVGRQQQMGRGNPDRSVTSFPRPARAGPTPGGRMMAGERWTVLAKLHEDPT